MTSQLITGIAELTTNDAPTVAEAERQRDAALVIENGRIAWIGAAKNAPDADSHTDIDGRAVLPGWVDTHSHIVFAGDRSVEFEARMAGLPYAAGGIATTVAATRAASEERLVATARRLRAEALAQGTTFLETKTGYGLDLATEERSARAAASVADVVTFLGAHIVPPGMDRRDYLDLVTGPMLAAVGPHVRYIDVFCESGAFDVEESREVLLAGRAVGLGVRVHGNQLGQSGGVALAVELGAASVDHCNFLSADDIAALAASGAHRAWVPGIGSNGSELTGRTATTHVTAVAGTGVAVAGTGVAGTGVAVAGTGVAGTGVAVAGDGTAVAGTVATLLPACDLSTRQPFAPARALLDAGAIVALATNCNPGSSYTTSMQFCVATAVLQMRLSVAEAVWAATRGAARAVGRDNGVDALGRLHVGGPADLQVLDAPSVSHLAYRPGVPLTAAVWLRGERVAARVFAPREH